MARPSNTEQPQEPANEYHGEGTTSSTPRGHSNRRISGSTSRVDLLKDIYADIVAYTNDELNQYHQQDEEDLWKTLRCQFTLRDRRIKELETDTADLETLHANETAELHSQISDLRNELLEALRKQQRGTPETEGSLANENGRRSAKLPDPDKLDDGRNPTFKTWNQAIEDKLAVNADHFASEMAKRAYVCSRTTGAARLHLQPRLVNNASSPLITAQDVIDFLESIYRDPNELEYSKAEYRTLKWDYPTTKFHDFLTKFRHLAGEAEIPASEWKYDLRDKIPDSIRLQARATYNNSDFEGYVADLEDITRELTIHYRHRQQNRQPRKTDKTTPAPSIPSTTAPPITNISTPSKRTHSLNRTPWPSHKLSDEERSHLRVNNGCFRCRQGGHIARDCPLGRTPDRVSSASNATTPLSILKAEEEEEALDQHSEN